MSTLTLHASGGRSAPCSWRSLALPATLACVLAAILAGTLAQRAGPFTAAPADAGAYCPALAIIAPATFTHRLDGEYYRGGFAVDAPKVSIRMAAPLEIMKYQVSAREYDACVAEGICHPREPGHVADALPGKDVAATGVSHDDAVAYAAWLSAHTGETYGLPDDREWAFAAGKSFVDDALGVDADSRNPALRWLADYNRETARKASTDPAPRTRGHYGVNELGVADIAGNVWEWTSTCQRRIELGAAAAARSEESICGIYVVEGRHRSPMSAFVRDPKTGGCSVGAPPDNLGFRLVRRTGILERLAGISRRP